MKVYIITGCSRGLGAELAKLLAGEETYIVGISRSSNLKVERSLSQAGAEVHWYEKDLADVNIIVKEGPDFFPLPFKVGKLEEIGLINNAATIEPIGFIGDTDGKKIISAVSLNLTAVTLLTSLFISTYRGVPVPKKVLNITSGAADHIIPGAGMYCATKAAINVLTKTVAEEQKKEEYPVTIGAISPGMIDTDMHARLRKASPDRIPTRDVYVETFERGEVKNPAAAAEKIIEFYRSDFTSGMVTNA